MIDRDSFFHDVRSSLFSGNLTQSQVNGLNYLLDTWESYFVDYDIRWLAYALATAYHETAQTMRPIEEYGRGEGKSYGEPTGDYDQCYYGRGYVQLTWLENYEKAEKILKDTYDLDTPCVEYPHRMLEDEPSALVLYDGMKDGWFTGVGLPQFFDEDTEDPVNARKIVNGLDKAETIAGYYRKFLDALA
jgi:putative chitinase